VSVDSSETSLTDEDNSVDFGEIWTPSERIGKMVAHLTSRDTMLLLAKLARHRHAEYEELKTSRH
jgi:hypothetical protein